MGDCAFQGTFKRMLAVAGWSRDASSGQERTLYSLRHTYATMAAEQLASKTCCVDTISVISITIALFKEKRNQFCKHLPLAIHIGPVRGDKR